MNNDIHFDKIIKLIKKQKAVFVLILLIIIVLASIFLLLNRKYIASNITQLNTIQSQTAKDIDSQTGANNSQKQNEQNIKSEPFNLLTFLFGSQPSISTNPTGVFVSNIQKTAIKSHRLSQNTFSTPTGNAGSNQSNTSGNRSSGTGTSGSQTSQNIFSLTPTITSALANSQTDEQDTSENNSQVTDIEIVFKDSDGNLHTYEPPITPPISVNWVRYVNNQDHYSIDYPADWQVTKTIYNGHEGIFLYMPGINPNSKDAQSIAFVGWKADYLISSSTYANQILLNGIPGTIYTNGPLGSSSIAAVFHYANGYFAIGSSSSDEVFSYIFDQMLRSLIFTN
jgi:hypothetical protein